MEPFADGELLRTRLDGWLVRLTWAPGVDIDEDAAKLAMHQVNELCGSTSRPLLVDMSQTGSVSRQARKVFGIPSAATRVGLIGSSPVDRVIANFVLGVSKLPVPTKFFSSEYDAIAWLGEAHDARSG